MPIRFRCYFCQQRLSTSRRKAGTVIPCPRCLGQLWVPDANELLPEQPGGAVPGDVELVPFSELVGPVSSAVSLSPRQIRLLLVALIVVLVVLFGAGVWVGRVFWAA